jgi:hypothetical protein
VPFSPICGDFFRPLKPYNAQTMMPFRGTVYSASRSELIPNIVLRAGRIEDYDDLMPLLLAGAGVVTLLKAALPGRRAARGVRVAAGVLALLAAVGIALDAARPYKEMGDHGNRDVLRLVCARGNPGDEWVVVNGAAEARFRFYLARFSPVPVRWEARPADLSRPGPTRLRLIAYTYQGTTLPKEPLEASRAALTERQGPSRHEEFPLDDGVIHVWEFGPLPLLVGAR